MLSVASSSRVSESQSRRLVLYEWLRGPRVQAELADQEELFPAEQAALFGHREAARAAQLYRAVARARGREFDLGVAACALAHDASLWTLNPGGFPRRARPARSTVVEVADADPSAVTGPRTSTDPRLAGL